MPVSTLPRTTQATGPLSIGAKIPINFEFIQNSDIAVVESDTDGTSPVTKVLDTDYTLTGAGLDAGGEATLLVAVASGKKWTLSRVTAITQGTDYIENDKFPSISHEQALDKLTLIAQEFTEELGRTMRVPITGDPTVSTELPPFEADKVFTVDSAGTKIVMSAFDAGAAAAAAVSAAAALVSELAAAVSAAAALVSELAAASSAASILPDWTNKSGGAVAIADVVINDDLIDDSFKTSTTVSTDKVIGVAAEAISDNATGNVQQIGETLVNIKGTVTRGDWIRHSTVAKQAESAGTTFAKGVFGKAMAGGTDTTVKCIIFPVSAVIHPAPTLDFVKHSSEPQLRTLRGNINGNGTIASGGGFTISKPGTGDYDINYIITFNDVPSLVLSLRGIPGGATIAYIVGNTQSSSTADVFTSNDTPVATDQAWHFVATGEV